MSNLIGSLYAKIGGDNSGLISSLRESKQYMQQAGSEMKQYSQNMADSMLRGGRDFRTLNGELNNTIGMFKAATPAAANFATRYDSIIKAFQSGKISSVQATQQLGQLKKEMDAAAPAGSKLRSSMMDLYATVQLVQQGLNMVVRAAKAVYGAAREGAEIDYARTKFDRLSESLETTSDVLMRELRVALRGTRSEVEMMQGASDLMSLGLAKNKDEVLRFSNVIGGLNMNMNQLVLALTNMTTMRFDQLGLRVEGFDAKVKKLEATGLSAAEAFTEAFLQQAEEQLDRVGNAADSNLGSMMRMEAAVSDLFNTMKEEMAPTAAKIAIVIADAASQTVVAGEKFASLHDEILAGTSTWRAYSSDVWRAALSSEKFTRDGLINTIYHLRKQTGAYDENAISIKKLREMTMEQLIVMARAEGYFDRLIVRLGGYSEATYKAMFVTTDFVDRLVDGRVGLEDVADEADEAAGNLDDMADSADEVKNKIIEINDIDLNFASSIESEIKKIDYYVAGGGELQQLKVAIDQALVDHQITPEQAKKMLGDLYVADQVINKNLGNIDSLEAATNIRDHLGVSLEEAYDLLDDTVKRFDDIPSEIRTRLYIETIMQEKKTILPEKTGEEKAEEKLTEDYASGGAYIIPSGFGETYPLPGSSKKKASSSEVVTITPVGQEPGITIQLFNPVITTESDYQVLLYRMGRDLKTRWMS